MVEYITTHWPELVNIVTAIVAVASLIANLTPTETDNKIIAAIVRFINMLGLNIKKNL